MIPKLASVWLLLTVLVTVCIYSSTARQCFCNNTHSHPPFACIENRFKCQDSEKFCYTQFWTQTMPIQKRWGCLSSEPSVNCDTLIEGVYTVCCNDTDLCNKNLPLPMLPQPVDTTKLLPLSSPSGLPEHNNLSSDSPSIFFILTIAVGIFIIVLFIVLLGIVVCLFLQRKIRSLGWLHGMYQHRRGSDMVTLELSNQTRTTPVTECDNTVPTAPVQCTISRHILLQQMIGARPGGPMFLGEYGMEKVAVRRYPASSKHLWTCELRVFESSLIRDEYIVSYVGSDVTAINGLTEYWLVVQYHNLGSLYDYLQHGTVSPYVMFRMAVTMCSGLAHLHSEVFGNQGKPAIAHRALTSRNILVKHDLTCCLSDFHLAIIKPTENSSVHVSINLAEGCVRYLAPEALDGSMNATYFGSYKQLDIYALGLVIWELCRRCAGPAEPYELPFENMVSVDPTFEEMRHVVAMERNTPPIPDRWHKDQHLCKMTTLIHECWYFNSAARPTAMYLKKKQFRLSQFHSQQ